MAYKEDECYSKERIARFIRLVRARKATSKLYSLTLKGQEDFSRELLIDAGDFISSEFDDGRIEPYSGLGFSIISDGLLNIVTWGGNHIDVCNPHLYGFDSKKLFMKSFEPLDVRDEGAFCIYETRIANYEGTAFLRYLKSERRKEDEKEYLSSRFSGVIN